MKKLCSLSWLVLFASLLAPVQAQVMRNGYIDTTFGTPCLSNSLVNFSTRAMLFDPDGKIIAGGNYVRGAACVNAIARLNTNGTADLSWAPFTENLAPFQNTSFATSLARQSDGKIIIGGSYLDAQSQFPVGRLTTNGFADAGFGRAPQLSGLVINSLAVQPDDKILAVGYFPNVGGSLGMNGGFIVRLNRHGAIDGSFTNGIVTDTALNSPGLTAVAVQNSKVLVGGRIRVYGDGTILTNRDGMVRLNDDGTIDRLFRPPLTNADVRAILLQPDGKILVAGVFETDGQLNRCLTRLHPNGERDLSFTSLYGGGTVGLSLALQPDGKILLGHTYGVVRLTSGGVVDSSFGPLNADGSLGTSAQSATAVALGPDGQVYAGATQMKVANTERRSLIRLWARVPPPPYITQQPTNQTVKGGSDVAISVVATGAPPITFQWRKNGTLLPRATNDNLLLTNVHSTEIGDYSVVCSNLGGATTSAVAHLTVQVEKARFTLVVNGTGLVTPNLNGQDLEIGRAYTLSAKPAVYNLFSNWTGLVTSSAPSVTFVMQSNAVLQANFVPSPFYPVRGAYSGLFYDPLAPGHANAGAIALTLDDKGGVRGTIRMGAQSRAVKGTFNIYRTLALVVPAAGSSPALSLALELDPAASLMAGEITNASLNAFVLLYRNAFSSTISPAPNAGKYTAAFPGVEDPSVAPAGDGFLSLSISPVGRVSGAGNLADGTPLSVVAATAANGSVPLYVPLYGGRGSLFGWLSITNTVTNDVSGALWWSKPAGLSPLYSGGFSNRIESVGSLYLAPAPRTPIFSLTNGQSVLLGGNLGAALTNFATLGSDNKIVGSNKLALTIATPKGTFTGSFIDPSSNAKRALKGVALPKQKTVRGFFTATNQSGRVWVGEAPVPQDD